MIRRHFDASSEISLNLRKKILCPQDQNPHSPYCQLIIMRQNPRRKPEGAAYFGGKAHQQDYNICISVCKLWPLTAPCLFRRSRFNITAMTDRKTFYHVLTIKSIFFREMSNFVREMLHNISQYYIDKAKPTKKYSSGNPSDYPLISAVLRRNS